MSILIKGMEMPTSCATCRLGKKYGLVGDCHCAYLDMYFTNNVTPPYKERPDECPLIHVPDHGRLVDADALWAEINKICDRRDAEIISDLTCLNQILSATRHSPTILPEDKEEP